MTAKLTDVRVKSLKSKAKRYEVWDPAAPGFGVRVTPKGVKIFVYLYRHDGLARRMTLGRYPKLSLAKARLEYAAAKAKLEVDGIDPAQSLVSRRAASRLAPTLSQLIDEYIEFDHTFPSKGTHFRRVVACRLMCVTRHGADFKYWHRRR